jgi:hypothetical protein
MKELKSDFQKKILEIHSEIQQNRGILPEKYLAIAKLLKLLLRIAKIFTPDHIDKLIDEIILAIELAENE